MTKRDLDTLAQKTVILPDGQESNALNVAIGNARADLVVHALFGMDAHVTQAELKTALLAVRGLGPKTLAKLAGLVNLLVRLASAALLARAAPAGTRPPPPP